MRTKIKFAKARRQPGVMNSNELAYLRYLEQEKLAGRVLWFAYEQYKLIIAPRMFYTPDFAVVRSDDILEFIDVKGRTMKKRAGGKVETYWSMEDAKMKMKLVADRYPHPVKVAFQSKSGEWKHETILGADDDEPAKTKDDASESRPQVA